MLVLTYLKYGVVDDEEIEGLVLESRQQSPSIPESERHAKEYQTIASSE